MSLSYLGQRKGKSPRFQWCFAILTNMMKPWAQERRSLYNSRNQAVVVFPVFIKLHPFFCKRLPLFIFKCKLQGVNSLLTVIANDQTGSKIKASKDWQRRKGRKTRGHTQEVLAQVRGSCYALSARFYKTSDPPSSGLYKDTSITFSSCHSSNKYLECPLMEEALFKVPHVYLVNFFLGFRDRPAQICHLLMRTLTPWKDDMCWDEHTWGHILTSPHIHCSTLHLLPFTQITEVV